MKKAMILLRHFSKVTESSLLERLCLSWIANIQFKTSLGSTPSLILVKQMLCVYMTTIESCVPASEEPVITFLGQRVFRGYSRILLILLI